MSVRELLVSNRAAILDRWRRLILDSYPGEASRFMAGQKDRFRNPVGHTITQAVTELYDCVAAFGAEADLAEPADAIVRVRAVQDFSPAQAVAFAFQLKQAVRDELAHEIETRGLWRELDELDARVDRLALVAFEQYMRRKQEMFEIRARDLKRRTDRLLQLYERVNGPIENKTEAVEGNGQVKGGKGA
jgi:hypothetical protein